MKKNPYSGKFIVFEGLDGSGQTTQADLLQDFLLKKGCEALVTKEPTMDSQAGRLIRKTLDREQTLSSKELQQLFADDRNEHLKNIIIPALQVGTWVVSDRYFFSSFSFGAAEGTDLKWLFEINKEFLLPDLTFLLRVTPKICIERIQARNKPNQLFEQEEKLEKVWTQYGIVTSKFKDIHTIDGEQSIEEVAGVVESIIQKYFF